MRNIERPGPPASLIALPLAAFLVCLALLPRALFGADGMAFQPSRDALPELDLRPLNETVAGQHGFIRLGPEGQLLRGDGAPLRLWGVNNRLIFDPWSERPLWPEPPPDRKHHVRWLAKRGVNLIRLNISLHPKTPGSRVTDIDATVRDGIWQAAAAARAEGVYLALCLFAPAACKLQKSWDIPGGPDQDPHGLIFFDPTLQRGYRAWLSQLLVPENPYTGLALKDDPALAFLQLLDEDSLLFWTQQNIRGPQREALRARFGSWLATRYPASAPFPSHWESEASPAPHALPTRPEFWPAWKLNESPRDGPHARRVADQLAFSAELMREFYQGTRDYLRNDLGAPHLIAPSNWRTADDAHLLDLERWTYLPGDALALTSHLHPVHRGPDRTWAIRPNDRYAPTSVLNLPHCFPFAARQMARRATFVTELSWVSPNRTLAEGPFLVATFAPLLGIDAVCWTITDTEEWNQPRSANGFLRDSLPKWQVANPLVAGQFPAASLIYRRNLIAETSPVCVESRPLPDLVNRIPPALPEPDRSRADARSLSPQPAPLSTLAFLAGPVVLDHDAPSAVDWNSTTAQRIDLLAQSVHSPQRQLALHFGPFQQPHLLLNTPQAQGASGYLRDAGPRLVTDDLILTCSNTFASVLVVSLDERPLPLSRRLLIQVATDATPHGWREKPVTLRTDPPLPGAQIQALGKAPWILHSPQIRLALRTSHLRVRRVLDPNGFVMRSEPVQPRDGWLEIELPPDALHTLLDSGP